MVRNIPPKDWTEQGEREWRAWHQVCGQLRKLGLDVNADEADAFVRAVKLWGEELHALRALQPDQEADALAEARGAYELHALSHPMLEKLRGKR
jgi:hypothetical protein